MRNSMKRNRARTLSCVAIVISGISISTLSILVTSSHGSFFLAQALLVIGVALGAVGGYFLGQSDETNVMSGL